MRTKRILSMLLCVLFTLTSVGITAMATGTEVTQVYVLQGDTYELPATIDEVAVTSWSPIAVDTSMVGYGLYTATLENGSNCVYRVNVGEYARKYNNLLAGFDVGCVDETNTTTTQSFASGEGKLVVSYVDSAKVDMVNYSDSIKALKLGPNKTTNSTYVGLKTPYSGEYRLNSKLKIEGCGDYTRDTYVSRLDVMDANGGNPLCRVGIYITADGYVKLSALNSSVAEHNGSALTTVQVDENGKTPWFDISYEIHSDRTWSIFVNETPILTDKAFFSANETVALFGFSVQDQLDGDTSHIYCTDVTLDTVRYVTGDVPTNLTATVETGSTGTQSINFNMTMDDGATKSVTAVYEVDASEEGATTAYGRADGFNFDIPIAVIIQNAPNVIEEILTELSSMVYVNDEFTLPESINVNTSQEGEMSVPVEWNDVADTSTRGEKTYTGIIPSFDNYPVTYTLTVKAAVKASTLAGKDTDFTLPASYNGEEIDWKGQNTSVNTAYIGRQIFIGELPDGSDLVYTVNIGEEKVLFAEDMESYTVGGERPNYDSRAEYEGKGGLSLGDKSAIIYENGTDGNKIAKVAEVNDWGDFVMIAPEHSVTDYIISGRFKFDTNQPTGSVTRLVVYNEVVSNPQQEVAGIEFKINTPGTIKIGNSVNDGNNANQTAANLVSKTFEDYEAAWMDFKIVVNMTANTYDVYANGYEIRKDCPLNFRDLTNAAVKTIKIKRYGETNPISFDDFSVKEYTYVTGELPESLSDSVVSGVQENRSQNISLAMNDGSTRQFAVKYTIDTNVSGTQTVMGRIDGFSKEIPVTVEVDARSIVSIKEESLSASAYKDASYSLPDKVVAIMDDEDESGSREKEISVTWDRAADTSQAGEFTFNGTITGYSGDIVFTLTVNDDIPVSVDDIYVTKTLNEPYSLPATVTAQMESGDTANLQVNWQGSVARTDNAGEFEYEGYVIGYPYIDETNPGISVKLYLTVETSAVKSVNYPQGESSFKITVQNQDLLPEKVSCKYENGMFGFEEVIWNTTAITPQGYGPFEITGTLTNSNLAEGFDGSVSASVSFYTVPEAALEDGLDTHKWDGPYGDYKFPVGGSLKVEQYSTNNMFTFTCQLDPENSGNKVIRYINDPSMDENNKLKYCALLLKEGKTGMLVTEYRMRLPLEFTAVTSRWLTGMNTQIVQFDFNGDRSIKPVGGDAVANAFPLDEWFTVTMVTDTTTKDPNKYTYDLYINGVYLLTAPWYMEPSDTNGVGTSGVKQIDWRNHQDEVFTMYLDEVKLYFLNDLLEDAYLAVNDVETKIQSNTVTLPTNAGGATISWTSSDESVITNTGVVTRPAYNEPNKSVTLTADITMNAGCIEISDSVEKTVTVVKAGATDADLITEVKNSLTLPASTSTDINLITTYGQAEITWTSSNESIIDTQGRVYPPQSDTDVTLIATIKAGNVSDTKTFIVRALHTDTLTDLQRVRKVMNSVSLPASTSRNISLPYSMDGVTITWVSKSLSIIASDGSLNANRPSSATATLTAIFTYGNDISETKDFTLTVTKTTTGGDSFGGSSSGGGSSSENKSDYIQKEPAIEEVPVITEDKFSDLAGYEWAKEAIEELSDRGIINGVGNKAFAPSNNIKREEFAAMIVRLAKIELAQIESPFSDVDKDAWYIAELNTAFENGIINGMGDGTFGTGKNITRQDMAVILCNLAERYGINIENASKSEFNDYDNISEYAVEAINFLASKGIINGAEGKMLPQRMATRAEAAKMIYEFIKVLDIDNLVMDNASSGEQVSPDEGNMIQE